MDIDASQAIHRAADRREALLKQLAHLGDEVEALRRHLDLVPTAVQEGRPLPSDPSFKELYALLAAGDREVFEPAAARMGTGETVPVQIPKHEVLLETRAWNELDMEVILEQVARARAALVERLNAQPLEAWRGGVVMDGEETNVFGFAYGIIRRDAELLQSAAYRLHESRLTTREDDLPK